MKEPTPLWLLRKFTWWGRLLCLFAGHTQVTRAWPWCRRCGKDVDYG